jgi:hypothetical protein
MPHVVLIHATFANKADADHIYDQAKSVAVNSSVSRIGQPGERTSHCGVFTEQADGTLLKDRQWHIDRFGIVREHEPEPDDVIPDWIQPLGGQNAYPLTDVFGNPTRVRHNGAIWEVSVGSNVWEPGAYGWVQV